MPKTAREYLELYRTASTDYWRRQQQRVSLEIFHTAAKHVPAYKKFLRASGINPSQVKTYENFKSLPPINKANYFHKFVLPELSLKHSYKKGALVMTATSGSTGHPTYFPRDERIDWQYSVLAEFFLENGPKGSTLLINCFGMGVWIGGVITYQAFRYASLRQYPLTIITPGINKKEIFHALRELAPHFDNVILSGYPPFIKDIIDAAKIEKVDLTKFHARLLFAAEGFTENFRDYVCKTAGIKNPLTDTLNIYGSAELGAMAFETPGSIFIRRLALEHPAMAEKLFIRNKLPTLAQFNPEFVSFEEQENEIYITANGPTPFVRYRIGDIGSVLTFQQIFEMFEAGGINLEQEARKRNLRLLRLPFVSVYERSDFSTTLYGLQIYPQTIKKVLEHFHYFKYISGKFNLETNYNSAGNQFLQINIELKQNAKIPWMLRRKCEKEIIKQLVTENSEYRELSGMVSKKRTKPKLVFWSHNHPKYFQPGIKQKWVVQK